MTCDSRPVTDPRGDDRLTVSAVAARTGLDSQFVRDLLRHGALDGEKTVRGWLVHPAALDAYLKAAPGTRTASSERAGTPDPMATELREIAERINAAQKVVDDLIDERTRALLRWHQKTGASAEALGAIVGLSRQRVSMLLRVARAEHDPNP